MNNLEEHNHARIKLAPGIRIVLGIAVLFAGLSWWKQAHYPHQIKEFAEEFSRTSIIQKRPVLNHARTLVGILHTGEHGVGVFVADIKTRTGRKLCEIKDSDYDAHGAGVLWNMGWHHASGFMADALGLSLGTTDAIRSLLSTFLLVGSCAALWTERRMAQAADSLKISCPSCGGHVKFSIPNLGQKILCPHCQAAITLRQPESLKVSCFFCKEHIEFPVTPLGKSSNARIATWTSR